MKLLLEITNITESTSHFPFSAVAVLAVGFVAAASIGSIAWFNSKRSVGWKEEEKDNEKNVSKEKSANYDRNIISAETAARMAREGEDFRNKPQAEGDLDTSGGYTVSREGLINNYAVEPEMYVEVPGDLAEKQKAEKEARREEIKEINEDGGKGVGIV